jgi:crossover junction endodeoxyribonuclease RuvC
MGYGVVSSDERGRLAHHSHGVFRTAPSLSAEARLASLYADVARLLKSCDPDVAAVEELFFKNNVTTGIGVAQARGVVLLACAHADVPVVSYKPAEVKQGVVGAGRATKEQVQYMVRVLLGLRETPKPDDAADALAIAICHLHVGSATGRITRPTDF